jgi:uncharacterized protein YutE (UPF0331/DUF86 family)
VTDPELIAKRLAFVESCVADLRRFARPELITHDVREERFVAYTLQLAIQAMLDVASHIVSDQRLGEPETNRQLFSLLARDRWVPTALAPVLEKMVGFRNILVHGYQAVDLRILQHVVEHQLPDLLAYVDAVRQRLIQPPS